MHKAVRQAAGLLLIGAALLLTYGLYTFSIHDNSFIYSSIMPVTSHWFAHIGTWFLSFVHILFGAACYGISLLFLLCGIALFKKKSLSLYLIGSTIFLIGWVITDAALQFTISPGAVPGGYIGSQLYTMLVSITDATTTLGIGIMFSCIGALLIGFWPLLIVVHHVQKLMHAYGIMPYMQAAFSYVNPLRLRSSKDSVHEQMNWQQHAQAVIAHELKSWSVDTIFDDPYWQSNQSSASYKHSYHASTRMNHEKPDHSDTPTQPKKSGAYKMPQLPKQNRKRESLAAYQTIEQQRAEQLSHKLQQFGIDGQVRSVTVGPVVTVFEYEPQSNIKISRILSLRDDLALALEAESLRINAPVPGKSVVGFEVAHTHRFPVYLHDIFSHEAAIREHMRLPVTLGVDTTGKPITIDITQLPHLLIAGSTGSGKSVVLHTLVTNILCTCSPDETKCVIIDPKRLEFNRYADIAHLLTSIVTDMKAVPRVLHWLVEQMEERYTALAEAGVRTIEQYHMQHGRAALPYIIVLIDEFADLMMQGGKETEYSLIRLAQMARAAGIHIVLATQRPSADIITGLIKVNVPSRIACKVMSQIDSRTVLDSQGAEALLGKGDMLWLSPEGMIKRLHGAYVSEDEIESVVQAVKRQREPAYVHIQVPTASDSTSDDLYEDVRSFVQTCDTISISQIQRQFRIGYNRSARLVESLEKEGIVAPQGNGKMRTVL